MPMSKKWKAQLSQARNLRMNCKPKKVSHYEQPRNEILVKKTSLPKKPVGRRLIALKSLEIALNMAADQAKTCQKTSLTILSEKRDGLATLLNILCSSCNQKFQIKNDSDECTLPCNSAGIWAANAFGTGFSVLEHSLAILEVPFMSKNKFLKRERIFHDEIQIVADKILVENGKEERDLATELAWVDSDGVTFTDVEGDCAWAKRSYGNKGTSLAGAAVLIGTLTRKPLFISTRIKSCYTCKTLGKDHPHKCFQNWSDTSSAMEPSMIHEGFQKSYEMHRLRYRRFIGDGDSSTFNSIQTVYNSAEHNFAIVEKVECKNHLMRNLNKNLRALIGQKIYVVAERKLFGEIVHSIGKAAAYAIAYNEENKPQTNRATLRNDIESILDHCIGDHSHCNKDLCKNGDFKVPQRIKRPRLGEEQYDEESLSVTSKTKKYLALKHTLIYVDCKKIISKLAQNSNSLILGKTTNLSEGHFSVFAKFLQGKRTNTVLAGSYHRKSLLTLFSSLYGTGWYSPIIERVTGKEPSKIIQKRYYDGLKKRKQDLKDKKLRRRTPRGIKLLNKSKIPQFFSKSCLYNEDDSYGPNHKDADMTDTQLTEEVNKHLADISIRDVSEQWQIHLQTVGQFNNKQYIEKRSTMITASIAGKLFGLRDSTSNVKWLDKILYDFPKFTGNADTNWGKMNEAKAIAKYEKSFNCIVKAAGLLISLENPKLGASPDGLIGNDGIIEVKCPSREKYSIPSDVFGRKTGSYLAKDTQGNLTLKRSHEYFYQVVMQLHITQRLWCDFIIWTQGPLDDSGVPLTSDGFILVNRIFLKDTIETWKQMREKFDRFSREDLIPEIVDSRLSRNMEFRQPIYRLEKITELRTKAELKSLKQIGSVPAMSTSSCHSATSAIIEDVIGKICHT